MTINFAQYAGFSSLAAAIVFAVAYSPLLLVFAKRAFTLPTYVHNVLVFFCASKYVESFQNVQFIIALVRVTAFVIRAVMIGVESAGENLNLLIADQILFGIGYAGLLYSSYTLVLDLYVTSDIFSISTLTYFRCRVEEAESESPRRDNSVLRLTRNRNLFRIVMIVAVILSISGSSTISNNGTAGPTSISLREASTYIFLGLTALLFLQTLRLARFNLSG
jgi:hypothetical protein